MKNTIKALGYDPGGKTKKANSVALVEVSESGTTHCHHCKTFELPEDARDWLAAHQKSAKAIGIDTMLAWTFEDRPCDKWLRDEFGIPSGTVQALGSLRGSMLGYGLLVANALNLECVEAHPKALRRVASEHKIEAKRIERSGRNEHERDAILAAYAAGMWKLGLWRKNLYAQLGSDAFYPLGSRRVAYPWPDRAKSQLGRNA